jgi:DNA-binding NarL/FixJ family response regulator
MADMRSRLELAHRLHSTERWVEACDVFVAVDDVEPLSARDLELLAESAQVMGRGELAVATLRRAYEARVASGDFNRAIAIAFWLWQALVINGEFSRARGWAALMRGLIGRAPEDRGAGPSEIPGTTEDSGWLLITEAYGLIGTGRYEEAGGVLETAARLGASQAETDLKAFATTMWGRALVKAGRLGEGLTHLDEAMVAIVDRDTTPRATSMLYCSAIATCLEAHEWSRAREWTLALGAWLDELPHQSGVYFGNCRVYRSLLWRLRGDWPQALHELDEVCGELREGFGQRIAGHAYYELGELHRMLGDPEAEQDYRRARDRGAEDQPGLALLRLSQGETASAVAGVRRALVEATDPLARLGLLPACVQIMLEAGHLEEAESAAEEIASIIATYDTPVVRAELAQARGAISLARGDVDSALVLLREATRTWREVEAPYAVASVAVLVAEACRALRDDEAAKAELESARETFARLGAQPDVRRVEALQRRQRPNQASATAHALTSRELEVLALVAAGASNHEIAGRLFLSDRTVHRHVSHIFEKLGVRSRTAAAAVAIRERLIGA